MTAQAAPRSYVNATTLSLFVAALSLVTAMYQGYLNTQNVRIFSHDVMHRETMRSCRDAAELFFEAKLRIRRLHDLTLAGQPAPATGDTVFEARRTVARFAAVATYLANYTPERSRERYTAITRALEALLESAPRVSADDPKAFDAVQAQFNDLNDDCVRSAR